MSNIYIYIYLGNSNPHSLPIPSVPQCRANVRSSNPSCGWQRPWLSDRVADGYGSSERAISFSEKMQAVHGLALQSRKSEDVC